MTAKQHVWSESDSGLIIPVGQASDATAQSRTTFLEIRKKAIEIEQIYSAAAVPLPDASDLGRLVRNAKELWENWFLDRQDRWSHDSFFLATHLDRIADAVLPFRSIPSSSAHLRALLSGNLSFFQRRRSRAKDILWELEVWSRLLRRHAGVHLQEPPDVTVNYDKFRVGIACKKLYSEKNVAKVLSQAVRQIEGDFDFGVVGLNLDDLQPPGVVLKLDSTDAVAERLRHENNQFLRRHERHFQRYLPRGRLIAAMVSTSMLADVPSEKPRFRNTYQWTIWAVPGLDAPRQKALDEFRETAMSSPQH